MSTNTTTNLATVRKEPQRYTWGKIRQIHEIGPYAVIEYESQEDNGETRWSPYVNGQDLRRSMLNLDAALLVGMAFRSPTTTKEPEVAARYAAKLLDVTMPPRG